MIRKYWQALTAAIGLAGGGLALAIMPAASAATIVPVNAGAVHPVHGVAAPLTVAYVSYSVTGDCVGSGGCTTHITIISNPSNGGVRAWESCGGNGSNFYLYGSWHFSAGTTSNTASCSATRGSTFTQYAGFDYPKSPTVQYQCYNFFAGDGKSGSC